MVFSTQRDIAVFYPQIKKYKDEFYDMKTGKCYKNGIPHYGEKPRVCVREPQPPVIIIPDLPNDIAMDCLARMHRGLRPLARQVCRAWNAILKPNTIDPLRRQLGISESRIFFCLSRTSDEMDFTHPFLYDWMMLDPVLWTCNVLECSVVDHEDDLFSRENFESIASSWALRGTQCVYTTHEGCIISYFGTCNTEWTSIPYLYHFRLTPFASCWLGDCLYVAGGLEPDPDAISPISPIRTAKRFKPLHTEERFFGWEGKSEWEDIKNMKLARAYCAGVALEGRFYVIGGIVDEEELEDLVYDWDVDSSDDERDMELEFMALANSGEAWDPTTQEWTLIHNMWPSDVFPTRQHPMVAVVDDKLYALRAHAFEVLKYEIVTNHWALVGEIPLELCNPDYPDQIGIGKDGKPKVAGLLAVGKELWVIVQCLSQIFALATVPYIDNTLTWQRVPFTFRGFEDFVSAVAVIM